MATVPSSSPRLQFARTVRERFLAEISRSLTELAGSLQDYLTKLVDEATNSRDSQLRRDSWTAYKRCRPMWLDATLKSWRASLDPAQVKAAAAADELSLELVGTEVLEGKILAAKLVTAINERVVALLDDLKVRVRFLEGIEDMDAKDIYRPEVLVPQMIEQWTKSGMPEQSWPLVNDMMLRQLTTRLNDAYKNANDLLIKQGVLPVISVKDRIKAPTRSTGGAPRPGQVGSRTMPLTGNGEFDPSGGLARSGAAPFWKQSSGGHSMPGQAYGAEETRMMTSNTPLARARSRAQGVIGQIRRLFASYGGGDFVGGPARAPSAALAAAIAPPPVGAAVYASGGTLYEDFSPAGVARVADHIHEKSVELKKKAETKGEKATIEIVALMFQAILAEDRIPPGIRVWFARLQMPVLRVALEDPDFFGTTTHPARMLIDRMGSCVMGFDSSGVQGNAMEVEIKRVVQVIEQYPETGKKVYQIVYDEFQKFLAKYLTDAGANQKVVSVAQQVEQKETLAIQYTIEMRNMLKEIPVRDEIREFLFKVWAEALSVSAVRKGPQHADTLTLKKCATDLVWAASAKPNRADRARVIQELPNLLLRLRSGMTLLSMAPSEQETHIRAVSDTLADAFQSKTQAIAQAKIDAMAQRLSNLEDFLTEDGVGDLPLDSETIEMMMGMDASSIEVVATGGSKPTAAMVAWAQELQPGTWYTLEHNGQIIQVQLAWRSDRKHLNLFAASTGRSYLLQGGRLAAFLQAGLLLPQEEETLTVRATRDALTKLEAEPDRLLA
jgi:hypothetical protein